MLATTIPAETEHPVVEIAGRPVRLYLSPAACDALDARESPLYVEMELYFSCLIRFKVRFHETPLHGEGVPWGDKLRISFRPVMTRACGTDYEGEEPPLTDFPISRPEAFVPRWLRIDYRQGNWVGEFGVREQGG